MIKNLAAFAIFPLALAYSGITAPFRGADEYNHFFRAYHVSIGRVIADFPRLPSIASSSAQFRAANRIPLDPDRTAIVNFPNSALYSPLVYAPAAAGIAFGRLTAPLVALLPRALL